jgi:hypothetical protein
MPPVVLRLGKQDCGVGEKAIIIERSNPLPKPPLSLNRKKKKQTSLLQSKIEEAPRKVNDVGSKGTK